MPRLAAISSMFAGSAANTTFVLALAAAAAVWWYLFRTRPGYELRAVGLQPDAAEYGGVRVGSVWAKTMILSGALAGLGGLNYVLGYKHYYEEGFGTGSGFIGIAVALVGRNHPVGVVIAALLFATLSQGGLAVNALVPKQMVDVLTAVVIIAVATAVPEVRRALAAGRRREPGTGERTGNGEPETYHEPRPELAVPCSRFRSDDCVSDSDAANRRAVSVRGGGRRSSRSAPGSLRSRSRASCSLERSARRSGATTRAHRGSGSSPDSLAECSPASCTPSRPFDIEPTRWWWASR